MRLASLPLTLLAASAALALAPSAAAQPTTKRKAELNVLRATRVLARWHVSAIDTRTQTLRSNTIVRCAGRGRYTVSKPLGAHHYLSFICTLRYRKESVRMLYTARTGKAFTLRRLGTSQTKVNG